MTSLTLSLPVAQWSERPTDVRKVMRSISFGYVDFFFFPLSRYAEYSILSHFFPELKKNYHHPLFLNNKSSLSTAIAQVLTKKKRRPPQSQTTFAHKLNYTT